MKQIRNKLGRFVKGHTPWHKGKRQFKECKKCGKQIRTFKSRERKYCSHSCALKGRKRPDIIGRIPINAFKKGEHPSPKTEFKKGDKRIVGKNNPNWKGGITPLNKKIRRSPEWREWREKVYERDDYTCQKCGKKNCELHPHHIKQQSIYPELRFDVSNGKTLCAPCHLGSGLHRRR